MKTIEGKLSAKDMKIGIVAGRFNNLITKKLVEGALDAISRHGGNLDNVTLAVVPGAFEIPATANQMTKSNYDAIICLGTIIKGDTPHFDYIASESAKGVANIAIKAEIPVIFGILTTDTIEQAIERAGSKAGNKGFDAAVAAIEMVNLWGKL